MIINIRKTNFTSHVNYLIHFLELKRCCYSIVAKYKECIEDSLIRYQKLETLLARNAELLCTYSSLLWQSAYILHANNAPKLTRKVCIYIVDVQLWTRANSFICAEYPRKNGNQPHNVIFNMLNGEPSTSKVLYIICVLSTFTKLTAVVKGAVSYRQEVGL